ncbi:MAG TPA: bacillithiol biosynthesis deacetylase BshB2 [Verrucomicrobiae bacterium]|nr:bacillithiol biosynthesis deacetylase BshB2 [Verrucomicrobiae bacterium]
MERHVLVVFPHPDDETFGCGGTIAKFTRAGVPVTYVCGTLGQMGRNMGRPFFATRESLPQVREAELAEACETLGIQQVIKLGLRDKMIEFEDPEALTERLEQILREVRPSLVITHYPGYAVHPDHNALGDITIRAVARLNEAERPKVWAHAFAQACQDVLGAPDVANDIKAVAEIKLAAIRAHGSQSQVFLARQGSGELSKELVGRFLQQESFWTYRFA